jgi:hypothetical protein
VNSISRFLSVATISVLFGAPAAAQKPPEKTTLVLNGHATDGGARRGDASL